MTDKDEALNLALEALEHSHMNALEQLKSVLCGPEGKCCITGSDEDRAIVDRALEALAQPEMRPDEISTDELIYMNGLYDGMKQERALWELSKLGQEIEAQQGHGWTSERIAGVERLKAQQDSRFEPERPWAGLTKVDILAASQHWRNSDDFAAGVDWAEATLKAMNT